VRTATEIRRGTHRTPNHLRRFPAARLLQIDSGVSFCTVPARRGVPQMVPAKTADGDALQCSYRAQRFVA